MNYHNISKCDQNNGDGLRVVLWLSGCNHYCKNCQNKQTWSPDSGIKFDSYAKKELFEELSKDYISGITFTGGDPLYENNLKDVFELVNEIGFEYPQKTIWIYTGYTWEEIMGYRSESDDYDENKCTRQHIVMSSNVLIDGEYKEELRDITLKWRGSSNQRVIDVQKSLNNSKVELFCD